MAFDPDAAAEVLCVAVRVEAEGDAGQGQRGPALLADGQPPVRDGEGGAGGAGLFLLDRIPVLPLHRPARGPRLTRQSDVLPLVLADRAVLGRGG